MRGTFSKLGSTAILILVAVCAALAQKHAPAPIAPDRTGMTNLGEEFLPHNIGGLYSAAIDPAAGSAYYGSSHSSVLSEVDIRGPLPKVVEDGLPSTIPAGIGALWSFLVDGSDPDPLKHYIYVVGGRGDKILKMSPGDATHVPQVIAILQPTSASGFPATSVIDTSSPDPAQHYAYFAMYRRNEPPKVLRVRLSDFSDQGAVTLDMSLVRFGGIDRVRHYAYFTNSGISKPQICKVNLATFHDGGKSVATLTMDNTKPGDGLGREGIDRYPMVDQGLIVDEKNGYAYLGTYNMAPDSPQNEMWPNNQAMVVRVKLGDGDAFPPHPLQTLDLRVGERNLTAGVLDSAHGNIYFGTDNTYPGHVYMIHVGDGTTPMREIGRLDLKLGSIPLSDLPHDGVTVPGDKPELYGEVYLRSATIDAKHNAIYFSTDSYPGQIIKIGINGKK